MRRFHFSIAVASVPAIALMKMSAFVDRPYERLKDLKDLAHILNEYPSLDDDSLFSDEVRAMGLELGAARGFVLGRRLRELTDARDRDVVDAFFQKVSEDVHWSRFVENSPWRYDEDELAEGRRVAVRLRNTSSELTPGRLDSR